MMKEESIVKKPNFDKWIPNEKDRPRLIAYFAENYTSENECYGVGSKESDAARILLETVKTVPLDQCKGEIQEHFYGAFTAADGEIETYYDEEQELIDLINLTICPET